MSRHISVHKLSDCDEIWYTELIRLRMTYFQEHERSILENIVLGVTR